MSIRLTDLPPDVQDRIAREERERRGVALPKPSKYHNVRTTRNGYHYDSLAEADYADCLDLAVKAGGIRGYIRQPRFCLGVPENVYVTDFLVFEMDGLAVAKDVKGVRTAKFKRDVKLWKRYGPCRLDIVNKKNGWSFESVIPVSFMAKL